LVRKETRRCRGASPEEISARTFWGETFTLARPECRGDVFVKKK
jgi:hypothetical protein